MSGAEGMVIEAAPEPEKGEVRCGIDDEPTPLGRGLEDRRFLAGRVAVAPDVRPKAPRVQTIVKAVAGFDGAAPLEDDARRCDPEVVSTDEGEHLLAVRFASSGVAASVRIDDATGSRFLRCLVSRACALLAPSGSASARMMVRVALTRPVFEGRVEVALEGLDFPRFREAPAGRRAAFDAYAMRARPLLERALLECARQSPPEGSFGLQTVATFDAAGRATAENEALTGAAKQLQDCTMRSAALPVPSRLAAPSRRIWISLRIASDDERPLRGR